MRHRQKGSRLGRTSNKLKALLRSLVTSFILNEKMVTTQAKAKALIPVFDRLVFNRLTAILCILLARGS